MESHRFTLCRKFYRSRVGGYGSIRALICPVVDNHAFDLRGKVIDILDQDNITRDVVDEYARLQLKSGSKPADVGAQV